MKSKAILLGAMAVVGGCWLYANGKKPYNSVLDENKVPVVRTAYTTEAAAVPIDFEKAASAAVPAVVHIKTTTKFKEVAGRGTAGQDQNPFGDMFGGDLFKRFFGDDTGQQLQAPDQRASGSGVIISSDGTRGYHDPESISKSSTPMLHVCLLNSK